jgi:hypothetical protein
MWSMYKERTRGPRFMRKRLTGFLQTEVVWFEYIAYQVEIYKWRLVRNWVNQLWMVQEQPMYREKSGGPGYMVRRLVQLHRTKVVVPMSKAGWELIYE